MRKTNLRWVGGYFNSSGPQAVASASPKYCHKTSPIPLAALKKIKYCIHTAVVAFVSLRAIQIAFPPLTASAVFRMSFCHAGFMQVGHEFLSAKASLMHSRQKVWPQGRLYESRRKLLLRR